MKLILFTLLAGLSTLTPIVAQASGQQTVWEVSRSSRLMTIHAADVSTGEGEPAMNVELCKDSFLLKDLGVFNESTRLESDWTQKPCVPWRDDTLVNVIFRLVKETSEEEGKGPGTLYCDIQIQTLGAPNQVLLSKWYWKVQDSSACR